MSARARRGFTLLEMLLSLAILAGLMVAMSTFLFGIAGGWGEGGETRLFDQHRRALARQLREAAEAAASRPGGARWTIKEAEWSGMPDAPRLSWSAPDLGRLARWPGEPLPDVDLALDVDAQRGLVLGWRSRLETETEEGRWHEAVLSPFVKGISYAYVAADGRWEVSETPLEETPPRTGWRQPDHIRLRMEHGKAKGEIRLPLGGPREGATPP